MEGNTNRPTTLSDMDNNAMCTVAKNVGVIVEEDAFETFDIVKELELARANVYEKQKK